MLLHRPSIGAVSSLHCLLRNKQYVAYCLGDASDNYAMTYVMTLAMLIKMLIIYNFLLVVGEGEYTFILIESDWFFHPLKVLHAW